MLLSLALLAGGPLAGCADEADGEGGPNDGPDDSDDGALTSSADGELTSSASGNSFYRLESTEGGAFSVVSLVNGGKFRCPTGETARHCTVEQLVLPVDCDWECTDGLLSLRGDTLLNGKLTYAWDSGAHRRVGRLVVAAGFDTWRAEHSPRQFYRLVPASASCSASPCPAAMRAHRLNGSGSPSKVNSIDFSHAGDANYVLDPMRGYAQVLSVQGLIVSGTLQNRVFRADRVLRLWTPVPACEPQLVARAHWFHGGEDVVDTEFLTTYEAERFVAPDNRTNRWLVRDAEDASHVEFMAGINDLWAERFAIDKVTCELTVTGEH